VQDMLMKAAEQALNYALKPGVEAEVYACSRRELQIEVAQGQVENLKEAVESGLGIRIVNSQRLGFAFTSDLKPQALKAAAQTALETSGYMPADAHLNLTPGGLEYPRLNTFDAELDKHPIEEKTALAQQAENMARAADKRISKVERSGYEEKEFDVLIVNSQGVNAYARGNYCSLYLYALAEQDGDAQGGFASMSRRRYAELNAEQVAREAAHRALRTLKARAMESKRIPCVFEPYIAVKFLGILAPMVNAEAVFKGKSLLADKVGQRVAAEGFSLIDDAALDGGLATFPFDDEGVPAQRHVLIDQGLLKGFLYDNQAAHRAGLTSTGHARRVSFRSLPSISPSNLYIQAGKVTDAEMVGDLAEGLYITDLMGLHTANPVSGDFSLGAAGIVIDKGRLTYPVRGLTVAGNMIAMLQNIDAVGTEVQFFGSRGAPSLRVASLSVAGS
jgi:PmbA protein